MTALELRIHRLVAVLMKRAAGPFERGPAFARMLPGSYELGLRVLPNGLVVSTEGFLTVGLDAVCRELAARKSLCAGLLLPVRTDGPELEICPLRDADSMLIVAADDAGPGVATAGVICSLRALPDGWREAHADVPWLVRPLRDALAQRPLADSESPLPG